MSECLSVEQLEFLATSSLSQDEAAPLRGHLDGCSTCRQQLDALQANLAFIAGARDALLEAHRQGSPGACGTTRHSPPGSTGAPVTAGPGTLPGYEILRELQRGGQGVVFEALQRSTRRKVAVKVLLAGPYASESARKRFEREIELVASLRHPNIIVIHDSGTTSDGHPFYAMDYIRGRRIDEYVGDHKLSLRSCLELFRGVCDAVNYAHQRGVIHRDLKPSNILVGGDGSPKVLDFGLAKLTAGPEETLASMSGQVLGSLPYLSPEQVRGNPEEIDVRTDVYSLGVLFYEILAGASPYPVQGSLHEVMGHILDTPPARPARAGKARTPQPQGQPQKARRSGSYRIDGDLEAILLKCLRKESPLRYQTAGELGRDLSRYLSGDLIDAKRDQGSYVLRKMLERYQTAIFSVAAIVLLIGIGSTLWLKHRTQLARQQALLQQAEADRIMAAFVHHPSEAIRSLENADEPVRNHLFETSTKYLDSPAFPERIMGARAGLWACPSAFWKSVDGGPLWRYGEWLELCQVDVEGRHQLLAELDDAATNGTAPQQYVAFCLIGHLAPESQSLADLCVQASRSRSAPGVVSAAIWAARRLGQDTTFPEGEDFLVDETSKTVFVRVPGCDAFRRGSPRSEPDRLENEDRPDQAVRIKSHYMAVTEITVDAFEPFLGDPVSRDALGSAEEYQALSDRLAAMPSDDKTRTAIGGITLVAARRYCQWLTQRSAGHKPTRRYRLPTEEEWEFACRAGNPGRFCFGDDADYAPYFANCNGSLSPTHKVATRMPNGYGLFDMHGGLWEWCDSEYSGEGIPSAGRASGPMYVMRGGAYHSPAVQCRSATRNAWVGDVPAYYTGLRLVLEIDEP